MLTVHSYNAKQTSCDCLLHIGRRRYASGGEDGFVRVHIFDPEYDEFDKRVYGGGSLVSDVARAVLADEAELEPDDAGELHDDEERSSPRAGAESDEERHRDD